MSFIHYKYKQMTISVSLPSLYWLKKVAYMFWKAIESQVHLAVCSMLTVFSHTFEFMTAHLSILF
jgi:hypothetical protein